MRSSAELLRSRRFFPHFLTMFLGAFNDNFFKSAIVILITYRLADASGFDARVLVTCASAVMILPFLIFSSIAGQIADKYERSRLMVITKVTELIIMCVGALAFFTESIAFLTAVLFLMGAQSAFFGPLKFSVIPFLVGDEDLLAANGLVESGTFISILLGSIAGSMCIIADEGLFISSVFVVSASLVGLAASTFIPRVPVVDPFRRITFGVVSPTLALVREVAPRRDIFFPMLAGSWFYFVGSVFVSQFPVLARNAFCADGSVATIFLAVFSIGIGIGSTSCAPILKGRVTSAYAPAFAIMIAIFGCALWITTPDPSGGELVGAIEWLSRAGNYLHLALMLGLSFFGGMYIVPLMALMQSRSGPNMVARVTACANVSDSLFMTASSAAVAIMLQAGLDTPEILGAISIATGLGGIAAIVVKLRA